MRGKTLGLVLIALGAAIIVTMIFPAWLLVLLLGLGMIFVGILVCK